MKDIRNNPLFTDITAEEEVSVQGGAVPAALWAIAAGGAAFYNWVRQPGNGFILFDKKGSWADPARMGDPGMDAPNGWSWGVRDGGKYFTGGYGNKGNWVLDRLRQLTGK